MMMDVIFNEAKHTYTLADGTKLPSVTKVMVRAGIIDTSHYDEWARNRGTQVHDMLQYYDDGELDESSVDERIKPMLHAWQSFMEHSGAEVIENETPLYHPHYLYGGKLDRLLRFNGKLHVTEIKTGQPAFWHPLQTAAYAEAYATMKGLDEPLKRIAIYLSDKGKYKLRKHLEPTDFQVFTGALAVATFLRKHRKVK